jgi:hypothetical protein
MTFKVRCRVCARSLSATLEPGGDLQQPSRLSQTHHRRADIGDCARHSKVRLSYQGRHKYY